MLVMGCKASKQLQTISQDPPQVDNTEHEKKSMKHVEAVVEIIIRNRRRQKILLNESLELIDTPDIKIDGILPPKPRSSILCQKGELERKLIVEAMEGHVLFSSLDIEFLKRVVDEMEYEEFQGGQTIFKQGDVGKKFYVVRTGVFEVFIDGKEVAQIPPGGIFGELAILNDCPRTATVRATTGEKQYNHRNINISPPSLFSLDRMTFRKTIARNSVFNYKTNKESLCKVKILESLNENQLSLIAESVQSLKFREGETIIRKGDRGTIFYMIQSGKVICTNIGGGKDNFQSVVLEEGDYFGERALILDEPRAADVIAQTNVRLLVIDRETFTNVVGPLSETLRNNLILRALESVPILSQLPNQYKKKLASAVKTASFPEGAQIIKAGESGTEFFILQHGTAKVKRQIDEYSKEVDILKPGDYFGEMAIIKKDPRNADIIAITDVECFVLCKEDFDSFLGPLQEHIERDATARKRQADERLFWSSVGLHDLESISILGSGTFGIVKLARHKTSRRLVALKEMWKALIEHNGQKHHISWEREVSLLLRSSFVCQCLATFEDAKKLYIITEPLLGGELFKRIVSDDGCCTPLPASQAKFYAACILLALESMHAQSIVYRDLKPENVLLDARGYAKLSDFGFAKKITTRTYTLCGTPEYLAPELVLGTGHGFAVDYWALGVLIYEMVVGDSPFCDRQNDQMAICRNILTGKVNFPWNCDPAWKSIIQALLQKDAGKRLGHVKLGASDVREHPWYENFDWYNLEKIQMVPPWIPNLKSDIDTSNFSIVEKHVLDERNEWKNKEPTTQWGFF